MSRARSTSARAEPPQPESATLTCSRAKSSRLVAVAPATATTAFIRCASTQRAARSQATRYSVRSTSSSRWIWTWVSRSTATGPGVSTPTIANFAAESLRGPGGRPARTAQRLRREVGDGGGADARTGRHGPADPSPDPPARRRRADRVPGGLGARRPLGGGAADEGGGGGGRGHRHQPGRLRPRARQGGAIGLWRLGPGRCRSGPGHDRPAGRRRGGAGPRRDLLLARPGAVDRDLCPRRRHRGAGGRGGARAAPWPAARARRPGPTGPASHPPPRAALRQVAVGRTASREHPFLVAAGTVGHFPGPQHSGQDRRGGSGGGGAQRPVHQARVAESAAQFAFQAGDRVQVLRRAGILVFGGRVPAQRRLRQVRQVDGVVRVQVGAAFDADDAGPRGTGPAWQPQVPSVAVPAAANEEHRGALIGAEPADHRMQVGRQVFAVVGLDVAEGARQVGASAQRAVDDEEVAAVGDAAAGELGSGGERGRHLGVTEPDLQREAERGQQRGAGRRGGEAGGVAAGPGVDVDGVRGGREQAGERRPGRFTATPHAVDIDTWAGRYSASFTAPPPGTPLLTALSLALQVRLGDTEVTTALASRAELAGRGVPDGSDLLVVDGPLRGRTHLPRTLGYIKTHHSEYLPPDLHAMVGRLGPDQRTPVFLVGSSWDRHTWYLRLPCRPGAPWAGVVRVECSADLNANDAIDLANLSQATLCRYASAEYKDARAPQNLYPIAGLERELRRRLGDPRLMYRALRTAAA